MAVTPISTYMHPLQLTNKIIAIDSNRARFGSLVALEMFRAGQDQPALVVVDSLI